MSDKKVESEPSWLSKNFNSTTFRGRANVAKATYGFIALSYIVYRFTRKKKNGGGGNGKIEKNTHEGKSDQHHDHGHDNSEHNEHHLAERESSRQESAHEEDHHGKQDVAHIQSSLPAEEAETKIEKVDFDRDTAPTKGIEFSMDEVNFMCNCGV